MSKVVKTLRNHWKKSTFGAGLLAYGVNYGMNKLEMGRDMRIVCEQALKYGEVPAIYDNPKKVTVILNPAANKRKAKKNYENYCAPLLHLAGVYVSVIETEREGHGRDIVTKLDPQTDAIIVAGGDGTLSEVITGLMRHQGEFCKIPIGVLPLGKTNTLAQRLFGSEVTTYNGLANAAMTVIKGNTKPVDAIRIELIQNKDEPARAPVYGLAGIDWGLWRQIRKREDAFWWCGPLKKYMSLIFYGNALDQEITANVRYSKPCSGCSQCYMQRPDLQPEAPRPTSSYRWWNILSMEHRRARNLDNKPHVDYSKIENKDCSEVEELCIKTSDLSVVTSNDPNTAMESDEPQILMKIAPKVKYQGELLFNGIKALQEGKPIAHKISAKQIEIVPRSAVESAGEENLGIDNEDYEVRPIRVTVLPNAVKVFSP